MKKTILFVLVIILSVGITQAQSYNGKLGYGISPVGNPDYSQLLGFFQEVESTCGGGVSFANHLWRDSLNGSGTIPIVHRINSMQQPAPYAYTDMLNFGWRSENTLSLDVPGDATNNWTNTVMKGLFLNMLINAADSLQPAYLFIGNETSTYWQTDSVDFLNWVSFYNEAYDSIKAHAPNTKVGTVFNYEHLSGQGELTGWVTPYWGAFDAHDTSKIDILGLTVYPFFHDTFATDIPNTYLDPIFSRLGNKPLAITETGWPADSFIGSWESTPLQQDTFVDVLFNMIAGENVEVVNWLFLNYLHDTTNTDGDKIFRSVALRDSLGNDRPALAKWLSKCNATGIDDNYLDKNELIVYPNPTNGLVTIKTDKPTTINVYNSIGKLVLTKKVTSTQNQINLSNFPTGIYYLKVENRWSQKIILTK